MKLSDTVAFLNLLETFDINPDRIEAIRGLAAIFQSVSNYHYQIESFQQQLENDFLEIKRGLDHFSDTICKLKDHLQQDVTAKETDYLQNSLRIYQSEMIHERTDYILNRQLRLDGEDREYLYSRIKSLGDWRYPGMCIRPGLEDFVKIMVPLDPLYLVDQNLDLLVPAVDDFDSLYQRRLRQYIVNDYRSTPILEKLPDSQFGFVFAYNFFNYKPLSIIERYLTEIFQKLRPGGSVIITYNNCDQAHGVRLAEQNFMTYVPFRLLQPVIEQIGYIHITNRICNGDTNILEMVKPGKLSTIRGGQTLAKIIAES
jgi:SAM-dependent methyltransferase